MLYEKQKNAETGRKILRSAFFFVFLQRLSAERRFSWENKGVDSLFLNQIATRVQRNEDERCHT
jgi:hypothetical protein